MPLYGAFIVPHPPVIIPEVGGARSRDSDNTLRAFEVVTDTIAALKPDTILVTTPHSVMYYDYIHISPGEEAKGDFSEFGAPEVKFSVSYDSRFAEKLGKIAESYGIRAGSEGEKNKKLDHGTMVPLYFLSARLKDFKIVRIGLSGLSYAEHYKLGKCIAKTVKYFDEKPETEKRYIFIASGDLSHKLRNDGPYGYAEQGPAFDGKVTKAIAEGDFGRFFELDEDFCEEAAECGLRSFIIMAGALDGRKVESKLLSYEGPFGVGYAVA
ncbi:MAG: AmmeMemoRadiSam system protein B, partial [Eubacteriales bacterium]|nr:AmmeMemoRadiSam system protein B [Eubacteriales bacterium]